MGEMIQHHPLFYRFKPSTDPFPAGFDRDCVGSVVRFEFWNKPALNPGYPRISEQYFEWIAMLESVAEAGDSFTMIELGAGYGLWSVRAARAIERLRPRPVHLVAVEADPIHFGWLKLHLADNGIDAANHTLIHAAISGCEKPLPFLIGTPSGAERPHEWYGQALADWAGKVVDPEAGWYGGFPVRVHENGWRSIDPPSVVTLAEILSGLKRVDLLDMDIQGAEYEVLRSDLAGLNAKVRRLFIATHSRELDEKLTCLLSGCGWECQMAYPCGESSMTPWGPVYFADGIQVWLNPRL
jgi:FkbM family methyltransferase